MGTEILLKESTKSVTLKGLKRTLGKLDRRGCNTFFRAGSWDANSVAMDIREKTPELLVKLSQRCFGHQLLLGSRKLIRLHYVTAEFWRNQFWLAPKSGTSAFVK